MEPDRRARLRSPPPRRSGTRPPSPERSFICPWNITYPAVKLDTRFSRRVLSSYSDFVRSGAFQYKIGVIRIPSFYRGDEPGMTALPGGVASDVAYLIHLLKRKGVSALLPDMRDNTGGSLSEALSLTGLFLPADDPVVDIRTRFGNSHHSPPSKNGGTFRRSRWAY